jgi:hypothetical protein
VATIGCVEELAEADVLTAFSVEEGGCAWMTIIAQHNSVKSRAAMSAATLEPLQATTGVVAQQLQGGIRSRTYLRTAAHSCSEGSAQICNDDTIMAWKARQVCQQHPQHSFAGQMRNSAFHEPAHLPSQ